MVKLFRRELIFAEVLLCGDEAEIVGFGDGKPVAFLPADGAAAAERPLREIERRLVTHSTAVAAAMIGLFHRLLFLRQLPRHRWRMRLINSLVN
jgi:hypothetical protein